MTDHKPSNQMMVLISDLLGCSLNHDRLASPHRRAETGNRNTVLTLEMRAFFKTSLHAL